MSDAAAQKPDPRRRTSPWSGNIRVRSSPAASTRRAGSCLPCPGHDRAALGNRDRANVSLAGHSSWVRVLGFSPDGQTLYTGGYEGRLVWWPAATDKPEPARAIEAHTGWLRGLAVSPGGQLIATCGNDNLVKLWNASDGTLLQTLAGHAANVFSVLFHPSGQWLLSGDLLGQVHQWEVAGGKLVRTFDAKELHTYEGGQAVHYGGVRSMALSPDGKSLACSGLHKATNPLGAVQDPLIMEFNWESAKPRISHAPDAKNIAWRSRLSPGRISHRRVAAAPIRYCCSASQTRTRNSSASSSPTRPATWTCTATASRS